PQPFKLLLLLVRNAGQVVKREQIQEHLWGGSTFVDFERGINFSINQIRAALCDNADHPRYVETLPRVGYRFVAAIISDQPSKSTATPASSAHVYEWPQTAKPPKAVVDPSSDHSRRLAALPTSNHAETNTPKPNPRLRWYHAVAALLIFGILFVAA